MLGEASLSFKTNHNRQAALKLGALSSTSKSLFPFLNKAFVSHIDCLL